MSDRIQCEFPNGVENKLGMSKVCIHSHTPSYIPHTAGLVRWGCRRRFGGAGGWQRGRGLRCVGTGADGWELKLLGPLSLWHNR